MRIHSKFKDYYDTAVGYGADPSIHYARISERALASDLKAHIPNDLSSFVTARNNVFAYRKPEYANQMQAVFLLGVCGKIYPCIQIEIDELKDPVFIYTSEKYLEVRKDPRFYFPDRSWSWRYRKNRELSYAFESSPVESDELFNELNAPIFKMWRQRYADDYRHTMIVDTNVSLKDHAFYQIMDAFTAFQEISRYLGNVLVKREKPDAIPDKYRVAQYGFDTKWSFRKHAGDPK